MPSGQISFVQREPATEGAAPAATIRQLFNGKLFGTSLLVRPMANTVDPFLAWMPDGTLLMAVDSTLYRWRSGEPNWTVITDLDTFGLRNVSRLAVSPKGDRLAIVAEAK